MATTSKKIEKLFLAAYDNHNDAIFRFFYFRVRDRELATDLTQDTFTKAWKYLAGGKEVEYMKAFIYKVARNLVIDYVRKKKDVSLDALMEDGFAPGIDTRSKQHMAIDVKAMIEAVEQVNEEYAEVVRLRYIDGLGPKDIAEVLGESPNVISVRLHRGMKELKKQFSV